MSTVAAETSHARRAHRLWPVLLAALPAMAILLSLGTWQLYRLAWKEALITTIEQRINRPPVPLASLLAEGRPYADEEYVPVRVEGTFEHAAERHFFATYQGASGFYVYTPLKLDDGTYLFVNRGFVPYDRKDPKTRPEGQVTGRQTIVGLFRPPLADKPSRMVPDNDPGANIFFWKDLRAMAATSGLPQGASVLGFFVDANAAPNPGGLPMGGVTILDLPNSHLQYAVTWYGLAAALAGVTLAWIWRSRRPRSADHAGAAELAEP